jgi:hypothetical protein
MAERRDSMNQKNVLNDIDGGMRSTKIAMAEVRMLR